LQSKAIIIPKSTVRKWQNIVDLISGVTSVPAALITQVKARGIEVLVSSHSEGNPYLAGEKAVPDSGFYCETVVKSKSHLLIPNALKDKRWKACPGIESGMISYLGFPVSRPTGEIFGTICVLDNKENAYDNMSFKLVKQFREVIESDVEYLEYRRTNSEQYKRLLEELEDVVNDRARLLDESERARHALLSILEDYRQTEAHLRDSKKRLMKIRQLARMGFMDWDMRTGLVELSDEIIRLLQLNPEEKGIDSEMISRILHPDDRSLVRERLERAIKGEGEFDVDFRFIRSDGKELWFHAQVELIRDGEGTPVRLLSTLVDISERKRSDEILTEIANGLSGTTGVRFFESLVCQLTTILRVKFALIGEFPEPDRETLRILALANEGEITEDFDYDLSGAPHENNGETDLRVYPRKVQKEFPDNTWFKEMDIESYCGILLYGADREVLGLLAILDKEPLENTHLPESVLRIFASRAAAELERLRAEKELENTLKELRIITEQHDILLGNVQDFVYRHDTEGTFFYLSPSVKKITGYTTEEWKRHYTTYLTENPINRYVKEATEKALKTGKRQAPYQAEVRHKNGSLILLEINEQPYFEHGKVGGIVGIARDITKKVKVEAALQESEEQFRTLIDSANDAIIGMDNKGLITVWNRAATRLFGYTKKGAVGQPLHKLLIPQRYRKQAREGLRKYWKTGEGKIINKTVELCGVRRDGSEFPIELSISGIKRGDRWYATGIIRDITERKKTEKELNTRVHQQASVTYLGQLALSGVELSRLMKKAVRLIRSTLEVEYSKILELLPDGKALLLKAGEGWKKGSVGNATVGCGKGSQAGYTLFSNQPIIVKDMRNERRFKGPKLLLDHQVISGVSVVIQGHDRPYGVLGAHTKEYREFTNNDVNFLQAIANVLSLAIEQARVEMVLRESEEFIRGLVNTAPIGIGIHQGDKWVHVNRYILEMLGYDNKSSILGKPVMEFFHPESKSIVTYTKNNRSSAPVEVEILRRDGSIINGLLASVPITYQGKPAFEVTIADITALKKAEATLRESREKFRQVIEQSNDGIYVLQGDRFVFINPRFSEITGYELKEISSKGFHFRRLVADEGMEVLKRRDAMRAKGDIPPSRFVFKGRKKDGTLVDLEVSVTTVDWEGASAVLGVIHDVTAQIQAQKDIEKALAKARQQERVKSLFLANMSHEIRTPLNAILGFTELVEECTKNLLRDEEKSFFDTIRHSGKRLMHTVHEILDLSQIEAGVVEYNPKILDLSELVGTIYHEFSPEAEIKGLGFTYENTATDAIISADEASLVTAISNLIDNAIKYTDKGQVSISLKEKDGILVLRIEDTGIGMTKGYMRQMFDAFSQESMGYTKRYQGLGLGLAITKRCLDMNDVKIATKSRKGVGTTFSLTFKTSDRKLSRAPFEHGREQPAIKPKRITRILIVEDDPNSQRLMKFYLKGNYNTCFAHSVKHAKKQMSRQRIDLILLDLSLKGDEDGIDLVRYLRKQERWKNLPVIAVTAHALVTDRESCLLAGCNDYLSKPIRKSDLLDRITRLLTQ